MTHLYKNFEALENVVVEVFPLTLLLQQNRTASEVEIDLQLK